MVEAAIKVGMVTLMSDDLLITSSKNKFSVAYCEEYVTVINTENGRERLYWDKQEWIDEPELLFTIIDVIRKVYEDPEGLQEIFDELEGMKNKKYKIK